MLDQCQTEFKEEIRLEIFSPVGFHVSENGKYSRKIKKAGFFSENSTRDPGSLILSLSIIHMWSLSAK